eukprot:TRINITY_DN20470_c0_g1_i1.p1 TRINITY_DN20470_c0_g1~~TRINITY_DN20470_c0_g1_i1.p1  ORF type:complete len:149 (-),score=17.62 TRINITY_DN20470_c0_g1_i1:165-611(-)
MGQPWLMLREEQGSTASASVVNMPGSVREAYLKSLKSRPLDDLAALTSAQWFGRALAHAIINANKGRHPTQAETGVIEPCTVDSSVGPNTVSAYEPCTDSAAKGRDNRAPPLKAMLSSLLTLAWSCPKQTCASSHREFVVGMQLHLQT